MSCYKDLGNYEYKEINEIVVTTSKYSYITPKAGMTDEVVLVPTITQTMTEGTENLKYEWKRQIGAINWQVVGNEPTYRFTVTSSDIQPIVFRFAVTDTDLGITTYEEIVVTPIFKFTQCWFLLQDVDGQAVLGAVDGELDERVLSYDVYKRENNYSLSGKPIGLGVHPFHPTTPILEAAKPHDPDLEILLAVFTDAKPYILKGATLEDHSLTYQRMLYGKQANGDSGFDPEYFSGGYGGTVAIDNGKLWYAVPDGFALMYDLALAPGLGEEYRADACRLFPGSTNAMILYDGIGNRFLRYTNVNFGGGGYNHRMSIVRGGGTKDDLYWAESYDRTDKIGNVEYGVAPNLFDPTALPGGFAIDNMCVCVGNQYENILAVGHAGGTFHAYEFCTAAMRGDTETLPYCSASWNVGIEGDISAYADGKIPVTTSAYFTRMFFYAAGNEIYRVDLSTGNPAISRIWKAEDESAVITGLKFKSDDDDIAVPIEGTDEYATKGIIRHLGAVVKHADGKCDLVEIMMTAAGEIEQDEAENQMITTFDGFENVVDFLFSFRAVIE